MSYSSTTIAKIIDQVNRSYFLPAIQRPYVWEPEQIIALFDSLLKGYPISTFLFWEIKPENRNNWEIYKFVEQFKYGDTHNESAETDGREINLVLDGQQRLTSLLIGLRGSYTVKLKGKRWDNPSAWVKQKLYIDIFKDPNSDESDDEDIGITYGLKFFSDQPNPTAAHHWFKVGSILDFDDEDRFNAHIETLAENLPDATTQAQRRTAKKNLNNLYRKLWKDEAISFFTEKNQSYDRVLDIFIRANDGGTKLSKSDLLLSMITSKWDGVNARDEIFSFVDRLNDQLDRKNDFNKDFVMRSCLVISDLDHIYKVSNFTNEALLKIQNNWQKIRSSLERTTKLINRFGIDRDTLTSVNALHPIAYYLSKVDASLEGSTEFDLSNRRKVRRWLLGALLNRIFGGNSDQTIGVARQIIKESALTSRDFPYEALCEGLFKRRGRVVNFDANNLDSLLDTQYKSPTCFLALSLLDDEKNWGTSSYHIDHIIPKSLCTESKLIKTGMNEIDAKESINYVNRLGNLQLLLDHENIGKSDGQFDEWIKTRDSNFLERNLIPKNKDLWRPEKLKEFVEAREELIREYLSRSI
jgi:uncharacterized protein with ParB-like and HNH nuclease domain